MVFVALATDCDGTLAKHGIVDAVTLEALKRVKRSGRKLIMVTGRQIADLQPLFPELDVFDWIVAENGATLYEPGSKEEAALAPEPSADLVALLDRGEPKALRQQHVRNMRKANLERI